MRQLCALLLLLCAVPICQAARPQQLAARQVKIDLPGPPAALHTADLNGDGRMDLVAVVAYTEWDRVMFDRIEDAVMIAEVVPALFNRREIRAFLASENGEYLPAGEPLDISETVYALGPGPSHTPILALTSTGVAALHLSADSDGPRLHLETLIEDNPVMAGTEVFLPRLQFTADLNGDQELDLLFPSEDGIAVYLADAGQLSHTAVERIPPPGERYQHGTVLIRWYPLPLVDDFTGDGVVDLLLSDREHYLLPGRGDGTFEEVVEIDTSAIAPEGESKPEAGEYGRPRLAFLGDLDGDGQAEAVTRAERSLGEDAGMRKELREAKVPHIQFAFYHLDESMVIDSEPYTVLEAVGYEFGGGWPDVSSNAFADLDGDQRKDLVTITLDFSIFQAVRILATKRISLGLDFHLWHQASDGSFAEVKDLDLSEKLKFNLNKVELGRIAQFAGDFDGDGRSDFIHLGRGKKITIHRGQSGAHYPSKPDLAIELSEELDALELVRVADLNADGRADLAITRPLARTDEETTAPVRLDLYMTEVAP